MNRFWVTSFTLTMSLSLWPQQAMADSQQAAPASQDTGAAAEKITVLGHSDPVVMEKQAITETLSNVPGGTNLISLDDITTSQASLAKVLNFEPGIVVQEFFGGNDQPRINIRGSGIQDNPVNRGIQLLYDGLALNQADGSFIIGLLDPEQAKYISVYRGANAMRYGATTLGGAINLHTRNAENSTPNIKLEAGSFGLAKANLALSGNSANWDYHLSAAHYQQDGFRKHSEAKRNNLAFNLGYRSGNWRNTSYLNLTDNQFNIPFLLTKEQAINNPESTMGEGGTPMDELLNIKIRKPFRHSKQVRIANKTQYSGLTSVHSLGLYGEKVSDSFKNPLSQSDTDNQNLGLDYSFDYSHQHESYRTTDFLLFVSANYGTMPREFHAVNPVNGSLMHQFADLDQKASNLVLGTQISHELSDSWKALASVQWVNNKREIIDLKNPGVLDGDFDYSIANPKLGVIYTYNEQQRYFANYSTSSEAPNFWQLATVAANPNDPLNTYVFINDLKMQTADTFEIGTQQSWDKINWELSYYYSRVKDELISVVGDFAVNGKTINYDGNTFHQGVELGINGAEEAVFSDVDRITAKFIYNFSDFRFRDGPYEGKRIAGIPFHLIQTELGYQPVNEWYLGANVRWQPQDTWVDHLNTDSVKQDAYFLLGLKSSYQYNKQFNMFIELNNITNETYQTSYAIRGQGAPDLPTFIPGAGFNVSAGLMFNW